MLRLLVVVLVGASAGCAGPDAPSASPVDDLTGLITALEDVGARVDDQGAFRPGPEVLGNRGRTLCVNNQKVLLYLFSSPAEASEVAGRFDREDPSNLGTAVIEWTGDPRFWQARSMIVQYAGPDPTIENTLTRVLGSPFARGGGREPAAVSFSC